MINFITEAHKYNDSSIIYQNSNYQFDKIEKAINNSSNYDCIRKSGSELENGGIDACYGLSCGDCRFKSSIKFSDAERIEWFRPKCGSKFVCTEASKSKTGNTIKYFPKIEELK